MSQFEGKVVLIAGTSNATAIQVAQAFSKHGAIVIRSGDTDLTSEREVEAMLKRIVQTHGRLDIACNDAADVTDTYHLKMIDEIEEQDWDRWINTHLKAFWLCMKHELLVMGNKHGGSIVNCSSVLGTSGYAGLGVYSATQHGVIGLTQAAARQYGPFGIRINTVCPALRGPIEPVVDAILWLGSERSSFVNGQAIKITGGV
jgi:NAD(P)-dependent dehydrogenase (short-subunit alcohol dehydrogenase family)